ncbi:pectin lyase-like protein [Piromyces finnis]|uniref:pectinesterase n=1 Tax=Piromyces finnis TaxID=1754191 RepID=A0A1Y1UVU1_9FUNG|nr:pectin lyase-like protein [Piromyces finnis]|eukprot:ORX42190.1 pectin lyase-like protein [Piromyces finnis]
MKTTSFLSILLICFIQSILSYPQNKIPANSIIVAKDGSGNFKTVQEAIDSLPNSASSERVIYIKNGTYYEYILCQKNFVTLVGENKDKVILTYDLNNDKTGSSSKCASFRAYGNNFKAFDITFENTAPFPGDRTQAPAINCNGNNHYFENCNFLSYQDTLLANQGNHYFKNCYIRGFTDFVWGSSRAVFDQCTLHVQGDLGLNHKGYLTANGNKDKNLKAGGFLFTKCKVITDGHSFYLGRLWKEYCYVIFDRTEFPGDKMIKEGWLTFSNSPDNYKTSVVGEYQCYGQNYSPYGRASYAKQYSSVPSINEFLGDTSYIKNSFYFTPTTNSATPVTTTVNPVRTTTTTTTIVVQPTNNNTVNKNCGPLYYQCGGKNYKGSTCCSEGTCKVFNEWYSMCSY